MLFLYSSYVGVISGSYRSHIGVISRSYRSHIEVISRSYRGHVVACRITDNLGQGIIASIFFEIVRLKKRTGAGLAPAPVCRLSGFRTAELILNLLEHVRSVFSQLVHTTHDLLVVLHVLLGHAFHQYHRLGLADKL